MSSFWILLEVRGLTTGGWWRWWWQLEL